MGKREEVRPTKRPKKQRGTPEKSKSSIKHSQTPEDIDLGNSTTNDDTINTSSLLNDDVDVEDNDDMLSDTEDNTMHSAAETVELNQGKQTATSSGLKKSMQRAATSTPNVQQNANNGKKTKKRRDSGTSSDEERWLSAIETGKLEDVDDELKKIKDPKLMTARQRAMYERGQDKDPNFPIGEMLMSLPTGYREKEKPQTAEDIQKAALKIQRRKQQADEKREKDKKKTMERLLRKQESKQRTAARGKIVKQAEPMIRYKNTLEGSIIEMPAEHEFPLKPQRARSPPPVQLCGIEGCGKPKVYKCSKTNLPLCSLACYRRNVQNVRQIMC